MATSEEQKIRTRIDDERLEEILDVATEVFLDQGFAAASTNEIARRANASKTTFYSRFPTKDALFLAVIERRMNLVFRQVTDPLPAGLPLEETLRAVGSLVLHRALSNQQIALIRVISMESERFPELAERFLAIGPERGEAALAVYMDQQIALGNLVREDPRVMAEHYLSLVIGGYARWIALGLKPSRSSIPARKQHLENAIRGFLRAYGIRR